MTVVVLVCVTISDFQNGMIYEVSILSGFQNGMIYEVSVIWFSKWYDL